MAKLTAAEIAEKWKRRTQAATTDMQRGIERVTEAPGQKAAAKQEKMKRRLTESIDSGKWAANVSKVSLSDWKAAAINKGVARVSAGVEASAPKMQQFMGELLPHIESGQQMLEQMPDVSDSDNEQRMIAWMRHMRKFNK